MPAGGTARSPSTPSTWRSSRSADERSRPARRRQAWRRRAAGGGGRTAAPDAVAQMGGTGLALERADALELDLLRSEVVEETAALAEEHRDEMDLDLVEHAGGERELRDPGAMDQHVLVSGGPLGLGHRGR